jgi:hypothetical protein
MRIKPNSSNGRAILSAHQLLLLSLLDAWQPSTKLEKKKLIARLTQPGPPCRCKYLSESCMGETWRPGDKVFSPASALKTESDLVIILLQHKSRDARNANNRVESGRIDPINKACTITGAPPKTSDR